MNSKTFQIMTKKLQLLSLAAIVAAVVLQGCSSNRVASHIKRSDMVREKSVAKVYVPKTKIAKHEASIAAMPSLEAPLLATANTNTEILSSKQVNVITKSETSAMPVLVANASKKEMRQSIKAFAKNHKNISKTENNASVAGDDQLLEVICAIFIPPLGVYLHQDALDTKFIISLILTLLFFLPGVIYSLLVVFDKI